MQWRGPRRRPAHRFVQVWYPCDDPTASDEPPRPASVPEGHVWQAANNIEAGPDAPGYRVAGWIEPRSTGASPEEKSPTFTLPKPAYGLVESLGLCMLLALGGCALPAIGIAGGVVGAIGGGLTIADESTKLLGDTLTTDAKIACAIQAVENARGDAQMSKAVGQFCAW